MLHACTAALPAKAGACHSLGVSKAPFASPQKPLGTQQGRWPGSTGSTALPGTFGCTCLHRSLACQSRCMSLLRRFESAVCQPSKASRDPAGPLARLHSPSRDLWLHMPAPQPCLPKPVHVTPYRRLESAVCQPSKASRRPAGPLARLHSPSRDLWLHMPAPQPCLPKPVHVTPYRRFESAVCQPSKASRDPAGPLARLHSPSRDLWLHMPAPQPCLPKPVHVTPYRRFESAVCQPSKASRDPAGPLARLHSPSRDLWLHMPALKSLSGPSRAVGQAPQAPQPFPGPLAAHGCTAALPAKAGACHSL